MGLKLYVASITPNTEVKKRAQRIRMVLEGMEIPFDVIDISQTGTDQEREFMRNNCKVANGKCPLPPQIFNENEYCGGYEEFENAVESNELRPFLKLEPYGTGAEENGEAEVDMGGFGDVNEDEDAAWARRMAARRKMQQEDENEEPQNVEVETEPAVLEEDEDAAWQRRMKQKRQQQQQEEDEGEPAAAADTEEPAVLEEDEDAAWQRRMQQKRKQMQEQQEEDAPAVAEEIEPVLEEDEDAAWQRRMQLKKKQLQQQESAEEVPKQSEESGETADVLAEDEDAAWQRRQQAKKKLQQQEEEQEVGDDVEIDEDQT